MNIGPGTGDHAGSHALADEAVRGSRGGLEDAEVNGSVHPDRHLTVPVDREKQPSCEPLLAPGYLRRIARLEAMPENASGTDKTWVHKAHADAIRHLRSAKRR